MNWNLSSRIQPLNHFPNQGVRCYAKRDDELGCGINGSKLRKYSSLMPFLVQQGTQHLIIIAGPQSNNLLAALQLAREFQLQVTAFLIKPWKLELRGNYKLSRLFLQDEEIVWIEREDWTRVNELAQAYLKTLSCNAFILEEGASVAEALPGAMSLAHDVVVNEQEHNLAFDHIFVDAGTGFSAAGLIHGLAQKNHQAMIHVLLLADEAECFTKKLQEWLGYLPLNYECFYPSTAKAFGALNRTIKLEVQRLAREEGILADPIYAAKLFYETRQYILSEHIQGTVLVIHSGGTLTMPNFDF